ncbi:MAG: DUF1501 domain-containing protein [Planctomycetota bacterium]|nr:DUF1501 domain-containing protein [Planctomycetota bacterium]
MLTIPYRPTSLCDGYSRREAMRIGGLSALGFSLPQLLQRPVIAGSSDEASPGFGKAKSVILLWLLGGPPQHETWDPKPNAPKEIRGEFGCIDSVVPGLRVGELMPKTALHTDKLAVLRAVVTKDQAHSSSGYQMLTGVPHAPLSQENVTSKAPNLSPSHGAIMRALQPDRDGMPSSIALPNHIANDGEIVWPGQTAGVLGRKYDPWRIYCDPSSPDFKIPDLALPDDLSTQRFANRRSLLTSLDTVRSNAERTGAAKRFDQQTQQAFDLLTGKSARRAFEISEESETTRDRYGRNRFGQSVLLARRMVEAGVALVQVNWTRVEAIPKNGSWDTHNSHFPNLKEHLMPRMDQAYSALLGDLEERGLLNDTLVVWLGEFGHTPKINGNAGRDHWGNCFSIALGGAGIRPGVVHGESDAHAAFPVSGMVSPADITATIFHCLGFSPETLLHDQTGRPFPLSRGQVIREIVG